MTYDEEGVPIIDVSGPMIDEATPPGTVLEGTRESRQRGSRGTWVKYGLYAAAAYGLYVVFLK